MYEPYYTKSQILDRMRERGIEPPRLYAEGFSHANCGGACVRGGQAAWELLLRRRPETFSVWEAEEQLSRTVLGKDISILRDRRGGTTKPLTLQAFRLRLEAKAEFDREDWGSCGCTTEQGELFEFDIMNQGGK